MIQGILYCRVSSNEQDDGYSIDAQSTNGDEYAGRNEIEVVKRWEVVESAKAQGRKAFNEMVAFAKAHPNVKVLLFEKPDRMTRNFRDLVLLYDLIENHEKEVHFFRTGLKINKHSKSSDQLQLDLHVVLARNFINNLREEVLKGMLQKVRDGGFPGLAAPGYRNNVETGDLELDAGQDALVKKLFQLYATGRYSLEELEPETAKMGLRSRKSGNPLKKQTIYAVLKNPVYYGLVRWGGEEHPGKHPPIISKALFDRVQQTLGSENRPRTKQFAFRGFAICGECGSAVTAERHTKKQKNGNRHEYIYYHCTGWKNGGTICKGAYLREEELMDQLGELLESLAIDEDRMARIKRVLEERFKEERDFSRKRLAALQTEEGRLKTRLEQAYTDKLDGTLPVDEYKEKASAWRGRLVDIREEIRLMNEAHDTYLDEASRILDLARNAHDLYLKQQDAFERRKLIDLVVSNVTISGGRVVGSTSRTGAMAS